MNSKRETTDTTGIVDTSRLTASEIQNRFEVLRETLPNYKDFKNFQCSSKMMVLLDENGCQSDISKVLESGFTDYWIPVPSVCLRECLEPGPVQRFEETQPRFLDDALELTGRHFHLSKDAMEEKGENITQRPSSILNPSAPGVLPVWFE